MHYVYNLDLAFEPSTLAAIHHVRKQMADAEIGNAQAVARFRPHITLIVGHDVDVQASLVELENFAHVTATLPVTFAYLGIFTPHNAVLYVGATVTHALLELHSAFCARMSPLMGELWAYYTEGVWVPHCTMAVQVSPAHLSEAVAICTAIELPFVARIVAVELIAVEPIQATVLGRFPLAGA